MGVNAEVQKSGSETSLSVIRKFSRRVQGTGLVKAMRNRRYFSRDTSKKVKKKRALKLIQRRTEYKRLVKEGKVAEAPARFSRSATTMREASAPERSGPARLGEDTPIAR